jgi:hypothetical protein
LKRASTAILGGVDRSAQPLACSLDDTELAARLDAWRQVVRRATTCRVGDGRIVARYPNERQLRDRLRQLIALERECCSFLHFDVEERPDVIVTELRLPEGLADATRTRILDVFSRS